MVLYIASAVDSRLLLIEQVQVEPIETWLCEVIIKL